MRRARFVARNRSGQFRSQLHAYGWNRSALFHPDWPHSRRSRAQPESGSWNQSNPVLHNSRPGFLGAAMQWRRSIGWTLAVLGTLLLAGAAGGYFFFWRAELP